MPSLDQKQTAERLTRRKIPQPFASRNIGRMPAWLVSIVFHVAVLSTIATMWTAQSNGTGQEISGPVGIAIVHESADGGSEYYLAEASEGARGEAEALLAASSLPADSSVGSLQSDVLSGLLPSGSGSAGDAIQAAGGLGLGEGTAEIGGSTQIPKAKTSVFGIEGEGSRFIYVFDRSASMLGFEGKPLQMAKRELMTSLDSLGPLHQFQIVFYNESPLPFGGLGQRGPEMLRGDESSKQRAQRFVSEVAATGGTQHIEALRMALNMSPDVIFFLTDADFPAPSQSEIESVYARATRLGCTIHTIQFGSGPDQGSGGWIRQLAESTLGKYRYMDVSQLFAEP